MDHQYQRLYFFGMKLLLQAAWLILAVLIYPEKRAEYRVILERQDLLKQITGHCSEMRGYEHLLR